MTVNKVRSRRCPAPAPRLSERARLWGHTVSVTATKSPWWCDSNVDKTERKDPGPVPTSLLIKTVNGKDHIFCLIPFM